MPFLNSANTQRLVIGSLCGWVFRSRFRLGTAGRRGRVLVRRGRKAFLPEEQVFVIFARGKTCLFIPCVSSWTDCQRQLSSRSKGLKLIAEFSSYGFLQHLLRVAGMGCPCVCGQQTHITRVIAQKNRTAIITAACMHHKQVQASC